MNQELITDLKRTALACGAITLIAIALGLIPLWGGIIGGVFSTFLYFSGEFLGDYEED